MIGSSVLVNVVRRMWGREGNPGRWSARETVELTPSGEIDEAAAMNWGNPSVAVKAVRLSCFLSCASKVSSVRAEGERS